MKIIGSVTSPYTRLVRTVCDELGVAYELEVTPPFSKLTPEQEKRINSHNPLMRVPIFVDGDTEIMDSRIIVRYLLRRFVKDKGFGFGFPATPQDDNILTVILGVLDAGILRFVLKASHPEIADNAGYMSRSRARIKAGLEWLDGQTNLGQGFGVNEVALICGLEWFKKRNIFDWSGFASIVKTYDAYRDRPSLVKTRIPETV